MSSSRRLLPALGAILLLALVLVAGMHSGALHRLEVQIDDGINRGVHRHPLQIDFWKGVTTIGAPTTWRVLVGLAAVGLWLRRRRWQAVMALVAIAGAAVLSGVLKALVDRARPSVPYPIAHAGGGSFPSGHALTSATALALLVVVLGSELPGRARRWLVAIAVVVGLAIGASRVALGVHYPTDVIGGWLVAGLWLAAIRRMLRGSD